MDRAKPGCKRHIVTDAEGVPLVVQTTAANVPDQQQLPALLDALPAVQGPRGRPRRKPGLIFGDRAYGTAEMIALVTLLGIFSFLAPRADDTHGSGLGTFRYVVERTLACFSHFRRLRMCYERTGEHFQALHYGTRNLAVVFYVWPLGPEQRRTAERVESGISAPCIARLAIGSEPSRTAVIRRFRFVSEKDVPCAAASRSWSSSPSKSDGPAR